MPLHSSFFLFVRMREFKGDPPFAMDGLFAALVLFIRWGEPGHSVGTLVGDVLVKKVSNMEYSKGEERAPSGGYVYVRPSRTHAARQQSKPSTGLAL